MDDEVFEAIKKLAHEVYQDDRHIATMARRLVTEPNKSGSPLSFNGSIEQRDRVFPENAQQFLPRRHRDTEGICKPILRDKASSMNNSLIEEELTKKIIGAAIEVHRYWGPGLIESIYEKSLAVELEKRGLPFKRQLQLELSYKGVVLDEAFRLDLIIGDKVVVELKVVKELAPIFEAQLLTYMRLTQCRVGLLMNFNVPVLKEGIKRLVL